MTCQYGELRTLQRTLAAGGEGGRKALADICARLSQPGHRSTGGLVGALSKLPVQDRLQFVQRCHLAMHRPELAGATSASSLSCLWRALLPTPWLSSP